MSLGLRLSTGVSSPPSARSPTFSPLILGSRLLAWWDASQGITVTGSGVSSWIDRKNGYELVQATDASRPAWSATGFNGFPGLTFDGTADFLGMEIQPFPVDDGNFQMLGVVQQDALAATAGNKHIITIGGVSPGEARIGRFTSNTLWTQSGAVGKAEDAGPFASRHLVRGVVSADGVTVAVDERAAVTFAGNPNIGTTRVRVGANTETTAGGFWHGKMRDVLVAHMLSAPELAQLQTFLLARRAL